MLSFSLSDTSSSDDEVDIEVTARRRVFRPRVNFDGFTDFVFKEKYRVHLETVEYILSRIGAQLQHRTQRSQALDPKQQLLIALHWLGGGAQYHSVADMHGVSKATVHRCVKHVCTAVVNNLLPEEVRWPIENVTAIPQYFMEAKNFPRVAGCVDGTLIPIDAPQKNESAYVDRNNDHSINSMMVCGPNLEFFYVSARWPGSVHDARVLRNSSLASTWNNGWRPFPNAVILGDSAYPLKEWLIPPVIYGPHTDAARRFLRAHKSTRRMVECAYGIVKEKFPSLNQLRVQPQVACNVILACVTFHNLEKRLGSEVYEPYDYDTYWDEDEQNDQDETNVPEPQAMQVLQDLVSHFQ